MTRPRAKRGATEVVVLHSEYGLPYSKGLMAQSIMATGLSPERSFALAKLIERRLEERNRSEIGVAELRQLAEDVLRAEEGEPLVTRFRQWRRLGTLDRPLVVLLGGVTGVGKSTVATQLAHRLGITRVIPTDQVRQVVRAFFSHTFMPSVHYSSFDVGGALDDVGGALDDAPAVESLSVAGDEPPTVAGFLRQARDITPGIDAVVERAACERTSIVVEGVHVLPEALDLGLRERTIVAQALLAVRDEEAHRAHFHMRGLQAMRSPERYLEAFERIRSLQEYLIDRAQEEGIPIVDEGGLEATLKRVMEIVLDAVGVGGVSEESGGDGKLSQQEEIRT